MSRRCWINQPPTSRAVIEQCKRSLANEMSFPRVSVIDFRIPSIWTRNDDNYWDHGHFRVGLAHDLVLRIKEAVQQRRDAEDGV